MLRFDADADPTPYAQALAVLTPDERARARRLRGRDERLWFVRRRRRLRVALGARTGAAPADVRLVAGPFGKPALADKGPAFSVARSGAHGLIVLSDAWELGCDIERADRAFDWRDVAGADVFTAAEGEALSRLPADEAGRSALALWTVKEAVLKCLGVGLSARAASVDTRRGAPFRVATAPPVRAAPLAAGADLVAAVAWRGRGRPAGGSEDARDWVRG